MGPAQSYSNGYPASAPQINNNPPSSAKKLVIVIVGGIFLVSVIAIMFSLIFGDSGPKSQLLKVASTQQEVLRVAKLGSESTSARRDTLGLAAISKATAQTNLLEMTGHLTKDYKVKKLDPKVLKEDQNTAIDTRLKSADQNNTYEAAFDEVMTAVLNNAQKAVNDAIKKASKPSTKQLLANIQADNAQLLAYFAK